MAEVLDNGKRIEQEMWLNLTHHDGNLCLGELIFLLCHDSGLIHLQKQEDQNQRDGICAVLQNQTVDKALNHQGGNRQKQINP